MTTTTPVPVNDAESSLFPSKLFNIQYPNCRTGMFSLREPFKNVETAPLSPEVQQTSTRILTPVVVQPTELNTDQVPPKQEKSIEPLPILPRQKSKRNAEVQCSLLMPTVRHDMAVQTKIDRHQTAVNELYDDSDTTPRYHRQRKLQPIEQHQQVYEIWDVESPPLEVIPIRHREVPRARHVKNRKPIIDYPDEEEDEFDYDDEHVIYARQPRKIVKKTYLPPNVHMICVRDDANTVSH